jgi:hypothetical protein
MNISEEDIISSSEDRNIFNILYLHTPWKY